MAELTALESKIGEVLGLAMAAQGATEKVGKLVEDEGGHDDLREALDRMHEEARETEERTTELAGNPKSPFPGTFQRGAQVAPRGGI